LYFSGNIDSPSGIIFQQPTGSGVYFNNTNSGNGRYLFLTKYNANNYSPIWRSLLYNPSTSSQARDEVHSVLVADNKLVIGGSAFNTSIPIVSSDPDLYAETMTGNSTNNPRDGFVLIFEKNEHELLHSTYFGGKGNANASYDAVRAISFLDNELYITGMSSTYYDPADTEIIGVPVFNSEQSNPYYQENLGQDPVLTELNIFNDDTYMFKYCLNETVLSAGDRQIIDETGLRVFPNPINGSDNHLNISAPENIFEIEIYDALGRKVWHTTPTDSNDFTTLRIPNYLNSSGMLIFKVKTDQKTYVQKVLITR